MNTEKVRPFWNPYIAGLALGSALLLTFVLTGHGLGASGFSTNVAVGVSKAVAQTATLSNVYFGPMAKSSNPLPSWITLEGLGVLAGAFLSSFAAGRFKVKVDGAPRASSLGRLGFAFLGGAISGLGARIALGCTSGIGLSGSATLAMSGFVFLGGFFAFGFLAAFMMKRWWK